MLNNPESWSARVFQSEEPDGMLLYHIGSWSAGDLYQKSRDNVLLYNTGSWSVGDFIPEEPGHHVVI